MKYGICILMLFSAILVHAGGLFEVREIRYLTSEAGIISHELIEQFEQEHGVELEVILVDSADLRNRVRMIANSAGASTGDSADAPPDLLFIAPEHFSEFANSAILRPLNRFLRSGTNDGQRNLYRINANILAIPIENRVAFLEAQTEALGSIGLRIEDIRTWGQVEEAALRLKEFGMEYPLALNLTSTAVGDWWMFMALSRGARLFDNDFFPLFDNPAEPSAQAFEQILRFSEMGLTPNNTNANAAEYTWAFRIVDWSSQSYRQPIPPSNNTTGRAVVELAEQRAVWNMPSALGIITRGRRAQIAYRFIEFMLSANVQMYRFSEYAAYPHSLEDYNYIRENNISHTVPFIHGYEHAYQRQERSNSPAYLEQWFEGFRAEASAAIQRVERGNVSVGRAIPALAAYLRKQLQNNEN